MAGTYLPAVGISSGGGGGESGPVVMSGGGAIAEAASGGGWNPLSMLHRLGMIAAGVPKGIYGIGRDLTKAAQYGITGHNGYDFDETLPTLGAARQGVKQTAGRLSSFAPGGQTPGQAWKPYVTDPVGALLTDAGNVSLVAGPALKAAGVAGQAADAGSLTARLGTAATKVEAGATRISSVPTAPYRLPITKLGESLGQRTLRGTEAAAGAPVSVPLGGTRLARTAPGLARFSPDWKATNNVLLEGKGIEAGHAHAAIVADQPALKSALESALPEDRAAVLETFREAHRKSTLPQIEDTRAATAQRIADLPFAIKGERQFVAGQTAAGTRIGSFFDEPTPAPVAPGQVGGAAPSPISAPAEMPPTLFTVGKTGGASTKRSFLEPPARTDSVPDGYVRLSEIHINKGSARPFKGAEDVAIPKGLAGQVENFFKSPDAMAQTLGKFTDPLNSVGHVVKLGLNPAWPVGNIVGDAAMALGASGFKGLSEYVKAAKEGTPDATFARLEKATPAEATMASTRREVMQGGNKIERATGALQRVTEAKSFFRIAARFDNAVKSGVFRAEIAKGRSPELALEKTMRMTGEFDNMSPFERDYVRRLAPYYSWGREIVKISKNIAEEHPFGASVALEAGRAGADRPEGEGSEVDPGQFVPFGQAGSKFGGAFFGLGKMLGPVPKFVGAVATGDNPGSGKDLRVGQEFGEQNTPGAHNTVSALSLVAKGAPQVRLVQALMGDDDFKDPKEGLASFLGLDMSHKPEPKPKKKGGKGPRIIIG